MRSGPPDNKKMLTECDHLSLMSELCKEWKHFFAYLNKADGCLIRAVHQWMCDEMASTGTVAASSLANLLTWLQREVPVSYRRQLVFRQRLFTLDIRTQKAVLTMFIQNANAIYLPDLSKMLTAAQEQDICDPWVMQLLSLLKMKVQPSPLYVFTQSARDTNLISVIKTREAGKPRDTWAVSDGMLQQKGPCDMSASINEDNSCTTPTTQEVATASAIPSQAPLLTSQISHSQSSTVSMEMTTLRQLDLSLQGDLVVLCELWHVDRLDQDNPPTEVQCLITMTTQELELACSVLMFDKIPEASLPVVCQHIASLADRLSHTNAKHLVQACLEVRVCILTQNASRSLLAALTIMAVSFPKPTIEGVLVPCVTQHNAGAPQAEIAVRVVRDVFNPQSRIDFFRVLAETHEKWNESLLVVIQALLDVKTGVDSGILGGLIEHLQRVAVDLCSSTKVAKVILTLIQKHGKLLVAPHVAGLKTVLQRNNTFLRKPAMAALSRLMV